MTWHAKRPTWKVTSRPQNPLEHCRAGSTSFATFPNLVTTTLDLWSQLVSCILLHRPISLYLTGPLAHWVWVSMTIIPEWDLHILRWLYTPLRPLTVWIFTLTTPIFDSKSWILYISTTLVFVIPYTIFGLKFNYVFSLSYESCTPLYSNSVWCPALA